MRFLPKFRITPFEPRGSSRVRAPEDLWKNNPVKRPDCQSGKGQKISSGSDSDTDGKYRYNRFFFSKRSILIEIKSANLAALQQAP
jgi:hypothetical protein